ncbi:MAG: lipoate--protein ligase family protein [Anaerolineales bacterium]|nr:lipoate--protein ligase family protein [Anaerolineales bacterium]
MTPSPLYPPAAWRLLHTEPLAGSANMAVDEAILLAVAAGQAPPTLRFFAWTPPCLSLGYAQPLAEVDLGRLAERGWGLVRRPTGGRAILHTDELTYSIIAPMAEPRVVGGVVESYRQLSAGLLRGLEALGLAARAERKADEAPGAGPRPAPAALPVCFEVPSDYEITADGKKLLGSAQVRKKGVVLQHGTLPLTGDITRICDALRFATDAEREAVRARVRGRAATLEAVLGQAVGWEAAAGALQAGFAQALNLTLAAGALSEFEQNEAEQLTREKYAADNWNARA